MALVNWCVFGQNVATVFRTIGCFYFFGIRFSLKIQFNFIVIRSVVFGIVYPFFSYIFRFTFGINEIKKRWRTSKKKKNEKNIFFFLSLFIHFKSLTFAYIYTFIFAVNASLLFSLFSVNFSPFSNCFLKRWTEKTDDYSTVYIFSLWKWNIHTHIYELSRVLYCNSKLHVFIIICFYLFYFAVSFKNLASVHCLWLFHILMYLVLFSGWNINALIWINNRFCIHISWDFVLFFLWIFFFYSRFVCAYIHPPTLYLHTLNSMRFSFFFTISLSHTFINSSWMMQPGS